MLLRAGLFVLGLTVAEGRFVCPRIDFGVGTDTVVAASALFGTDSADLSISKLPDLPSDFDQWPGEPSPETRDVLVRQYFASGVDPRPWKFSPESGDLLELPDFVCDYDNYLYYAQYDVDSPDYSDYDEPAYLDGYSDLYGFVETNDCYAPAEVEFIHELHDPDNCGRYCQLRYNIRPYGHYAPTDVEF